MVILELLVLWLSPFQRFLLQFPSTRSNVFLFFPAGNTAAFCFNTQCIIMNREIPLCASCLSRTVSPPASIGCFSGLLSSAFKQLSLYIVQLSSLLLMRGLIQYNLLLLFRNWTSPHPSGICLLTQPSVRLLLLVSYHTLTSWWVSLIQLSALPVLGQSLLGNISPSNLQVASTQCTHQGTRR